MNAQPCLIYDDPRPITAVWYEGDFGGWRVGDLAYNCTRIVAYKEHGQGDFVPWLAVYSGDEIIARIPASMVTIRYGELPG